MSFQLPCRSSRKETPLDQTYRIGAIRQPPAAASRCPPPGQANRGRPDSPPPHSSLPPQCRFHGSDPAPRPSFSPVLFASTWDGSFIYAAPHIASLARLFVSRLNPAAVAAAAGGGLEALSPSPSENGLLPPINSTSRRISVNQASGPPRSLPPDG